MLWPQKLLIYGKEENYVNLLEEYTKFCILHVGNETATMSKLAWNHIRISLRTSGSLLYKTVMMLALFL